MVRSRCSFFLVKSTEERRLSGMAMGGGAKEAQIVAVEEPVKRMGVGLAQFSGLFQHTEVVV